MSVKRHREMWVVPILIVAKMKIDICRMRFLQQVF
jgi:hypothetical protein